LTNSDEGIINYITILGAIYEEETITVNEIEVASSDPVYTESSTSISKSFSLGESVTAWSDTGTDFKVTAKYIGYTARPGYPFNPYQDYQFTITKLNSDLTVKRTDWTVSGATKYNESNMKCSVHRPTYSVGDMVFQQGAFSISIVIYTKEQTDGGALEYENDYPDEEVTSEITYHQVQATCKDSASIIKYGERKPNNEGTLDYPLAETDAQCKRIGTNIIKDSHRFIEQPDFVVPFNPKLIVGQVVNMTDTKIGYSADDYFVEEVVHYIEIPADGRIKARTRIGCVWYA
jgi:hypothetical protein